jgi:hypothetical protein
MPSLEQAGGVWSVQLVIEPFQFGTDFLFSSDLILGAKLLCIAQITDEYAPNLVAVV